MAQGDFVSDGQPQTRPAAGAASGRIHPVEPLEQVRQRFGGNAAALVVNANGYPAVEFGRKADGHGAAGGAVPNRVFQKVAEQAAEVLGVAA